MKMQTLIQNLFRVPLKLAAAGLALHCGALALSPVAAGETTDFEGLRIEVRGPADGRPVLMIPGLNSAAAVWDQTCAALIAQAEVQCHLVNLPGFAGVPAVKGDAPFLDTQAARLLRYVHDEQLQRPVVIGHSLGGMVSVLMALAEPETLSQLVIVDSLPFFSAAMNPIMDAKAMQPIAENMRKQMQEADDATYGKRLEAALIGMSNQAERMPTLKEWGHASDRHTTTQAMFEIFTRDLRTEVAEVRTPTLVLGAWAAYKAYGSTEETTRKIYTDQYAKLEGAEVRMSATGYHFLMWDDQDWLVAQILSVL